MQRFLDKPRGGWRSLESDKRKRLRADRKRFWDARRGEEDGNDHRHEPYMVQQNFVLGAF